MTNKEKATKVLNYLEEQTSSVAIGLMHPYLQDYQLADLFDKLVVDGALQDEEPKYEQLSFKDLCDKLQYFYVRASEKKNADDICEEIRDFIRKSGHNCLEDGWDSDVDAKEWLQEHYPDDYDEDDDEKELECSSVTYENLRFLCEGKYDGEPYFCEISIVFYGDWDTGTGVFCVEKD